MTAKKVRVTYKCLHPSCIVFCKEGMLTMDEDVFKGLLAENKEKDVFKSPRGACRMGFSQPFKSEGVENLDENAAAGEAQKQVASLDSDNPLEVLVAEHQRVLEKLDEIEEHLKKRDVDGLWVASAALENDIVLHSVQKEEELLFPRVGNLVPLAEGLVTIIQEDHREFMTLLHSFRSALVDGDILDGLARSIIVNLRSHIRKEDDEFFYLLDKHLDHKTKEIILKEMKKMYEAFVPMEAGDRAAARDRSTSKARSHYDEAADAARDARLADAASGGGCCHESPD